MTTPDDGGPAFACAADNGHQPGMSLRDYFAAQALAGVLACTRSYSGYSGAKGMAKLAYEAADEMLEARKTKP